MTLVFFAISLYSIIMQVRVMITSIPLGTRLESLLLAIIADRFRGFPQSLLANVKS
jgi:hypothetical protein